MKFFIFFCAVFSISISNAFGMQKYFGAPEEINDWKISCSVDKGSIIRKEETWFFKTSKNRCKGGIFQQRAEINTKKALSTSTKAKYDFQSIFSFKSNKFDYEQFDIFQLHDGRDGCAPPLKVTIQANGKLRLRADYQTGAGEQCERDIMQSTGAGMTSIVRDGTDYKLNVILDFDGKSGFNVEVFLDGMLEVSGKYIPPKGKAIPSKYFYFKHGVYSRNIFDYELKSDISLKLIR